MQVPGDSYPAATVARPQKAAVGASAGASRRRRWGPNLSSSCSSDGGCLRHQNHRVGTASRSTAAARWLVAKEGGYGSALSSLFSLFLDDAGLGREFELRHSRQILTSNFPSDSRARRKHVRQRFPCRDPTESPTENPTERSSEKFDGKSDGNKRISCSVGVGEYA
ncbi:hypothetical protein PIB30_089720 [Stylosanthes scabra]|uniref:Uncharacterized protein n=1 Tax=Stylosanthes scabra TaxID=79078 RepID=A0ABU6SWD2_9FABA|nr:hypothetical protein [Stylosanthes scabra]